MPMFQGPERPRLPKSDGPQRSIEMKHSSLLEEIESLISRPHTEHSRIAAMMALDGVDDPSVMRLLSGCVYSKWSAP